jgi:RNA polymerase sigma factor (TIGR02999 family)
VSKSGHIPECSPAHQVLSQGEVTELLQRWSGGDSRALDDLIPIVYDELRRLANYFLQQESDARTLQGTALVHEVYIRLCGQEELRWENRAHFFAVAAKMIRHILVDHARRNQASKRGGRLSHVTLEEALTVPVCSTLDLVGLEESLEELEAFDLRKAQVVELRFFGGLKAREIAQVLDTTEATVRRDWTIARAWLYRRLEEKLVL